jgi:hypothetical protein
MSFCSGNAADYLHSPVHENACCRALAAKRSKQKALKRASEP